MLLSSRRVILNIDINLCKEKFNSLALWLKLHRSFISMQAQFFPPVRPSTSQTVNSPGSSLETSFQVFHWIIIPQNNLSSSLINIKSIINWKEWKNGFLTNLIDRHNFYLFKTRFPIFLLPKHYINKLEIFQNIISNWCEEIISYCTLLKMLGSTAILSLLHSITSSWLGRRYGWVNILKWQIMALKIFKVCAII